jgi:hypothetical protein
VNLARPDDFAAVDAVVGRAAGDDPWGALGDAAGARPAAELVEKVRLLGVPGAVVDERRSAGPVSAGWAAQQRWPAGDVHRVDRLRVTDLSSMWAGPLTAKLLADAGATVTKVESTARPDGARAQPAFYRRLHPADQTEVRVDLGTDRGRRQLRELVEVADVVVESSRPRALEQLGVGPANVASRPGRVWISITGYGRQAPGRDWVAFGDDAAVAGGIVGWAAEDTPVFCGDALADPVSGLSAAAAAFEALARGGGALLDVSMAASCRALLDPVTPDTPRRSPQAEPAPGGGWQLVVGGEAVPVVAAPAPSGDGTRSGAGSG